MEHAPVAPILGGLKKKDRLSPARNLRLGTTMRLQPEKKQPNHQPTNEENPGCFMEALKIHKDSLKIETAYLVNTNNIPGINTQCINFILTFCEMDFFHGQFRDEKNQDMHDLFNNTYAASHLQG
jgi:hypothetical protein